MRNRIEFKLLLYRFSHCPPRDLAKYVSTLQYRKRIHTIFQVIPIELSKIIQVEFIIYLKSARYTENATLKAVVPPSHLPTCNSLLMLVYSWKGAERHNTGYKYLRGIYYKAIQIKYVSLLLQKNNSLLQIYNVY